MAAVAWATAGLDARAARAATPRAELVMTWAPGRPDAVAAAERAARAAGAAVIDATPSAAVVPADRAALRAGRAAYEALRFDEAQKALAEAARSLERTGGAGWSVGELADLFLYRALTAVQLGEAEAAWEDFVHAATVDPARVLDPAELPPRAIEQFERARAHVAAMPRGAVRIVGGAGCQVAVDGRAVGAGERDGALELWRGRHWLVASCPGRQPVQRGFDVVGAALEQAIDGAPLPPFSDDAALVQARVLGARAVVTVVVTGELALLRRVGRDGREQERRALRLSAARTALSGAPDEAPALAALEQELARLLQPEARPARTAWYRSRWVWAAAGVVAASAVLLPLALQDDGPAEVVIRPSGAPW